ncbi:MAG: hypothetical protein EBT96_11965 [Betaproteobacteria bacterium]|nr:hypothetical protein [Betaproteobacteria bacterium]
MDRPLDFSRCDLARVLDHTGQDARGASLANSFIQGTSEGIVGLVGTLGPFLRIRPAERLADLTEELSHLADQAAGEGLGASQTAPHRAAADMHLGTGLAIGPTGHADHAGAVGGQ